jgi:CDP-diacylglycerol--glycerol-3-phosphate 3-phosphatidyltransferase
MHQTSPQESSSARDAVADRARRLVAPVSLALQKLHITPNQLTIAGAVLHLVAAWLIIADQPIIAGFVFVVGSLFDMLDGSLARLSAMVTPFGAFLDSTLDRASEGVILAAVTYQFAVQGHPVDAALVVLALLGSLLVSYTRARAEALGVSAKLGIMSRPERVVLIAIGLFFNVMPYVIYLLVVLTAFTVVQRVIFTYRALNRV